MKKVILVFALVIGGVLAASPLAHGVSSVTCGAPTEDDPQVLGAVTVSSVNVPAGTFCELEGTNVLGSVTVGPGGGVDAFGGTSIRGSLTVAAQAGAAMFDSTVGGSIFCTGCEFQDVVDATVRGNVQITGESQGSFILGAVIRGNLSITGSAAGDFAFYILQSQIGGSLTFVGNEGPAYIAENSVGGSARVSSNASAGTYDDDVPDLPAAVDLTVADNRVRGSLQCQGNNPPPVGDGNQASAKLGQCAAL